MNAWARQYESVELTEATAATAVDTAEGEVASFDELSATVWQYDRVASGCLGYLVVDGGVAAVVDPLEAFADRYVADARDHGAELRYAIDTHVHADHVSGVRAVADATDAEPVVPTGATDRGLAFEARLVADGESLPLAGTALRARTLPGHTSEMLGFALVDRDRTTENPGPLWLTGDTVFASAVARPDLEVETTGAADDDLPAYARRLYRTIHERLLALPDETVLAPGHRQQLREGPAVVTVGDLPRRLDVLDLGIKAFVEHIVSRMGPQPANVEQIVAINRGRASTADDERFELELGPNNCAAG
jgi:glyoxylase-like metal-dependent hydrolase (beta-lactamase superfamily II)